MKHFEKNQTKERKGDRKKEEGFSMLSVIFAILVMSAVGLTLSPLLANRARGSAEDIRAQQAFYVADGGIQYEMMKDFRDSLDFTTISNSPVSNKTLGTGQFSITLDSATKTTFEADVTSTAQVTNSTRIIQEHIKQTFDATGAMSSGGSIDLTSKQSGGGTVNGPVTYGQGHSFNADGGYTVTNTPTVGPVPPVPSLTSLIALTTSSVSSLTINGDYTGNVHVTGSVSISDGGTISGIIVADGNVSIDVKHDNTRNLNGTIAAGGSMTFDAHQSSNGTFTAQSAGGQMQPLLIAVGDINFSDFQQTNFLFKGLIRSGGDIDFKLRQQDTINIQGGVVATGDITADSKQSSDLTINYGSGYAFLPKHLAVTNWKEN